MSNITITQTESAASINITSNTTRIGIASVSGYGIQGIPGETGPQGEQGPPGLPGDPASIEDVPGLVEALAGKAALVHTHVLNDITDFEGSVLAGGTF